MLRATAIFTLFVAVLAAGAVLAQSVTPVRAIRSHTILAAGDLTLAEAAVPGAVAEIAAAVGQEARVTLYPGRPILAGQIGAPALVERNQLVRMSYMRGAALHRHRRPRARPRRRGRAGAGHEPHLAPDHHRHGGRRTAASRSDHDAHDSPPFSRSCSPPAACTTSAGRRR